MTAPDPGLTDLIAAALVRCSPTLTDDFEMLPHHRKEAWRVRARELVLVVEQHTNRRITELEGACEGWKSTVKVRTKRGDHWRDRALAAEAKIARVHEVYENLCPGDDMTFVAYSDLTAALEGEQR